jgi:hypothetical protein
MFGVFVSRIKRKSLIVFLFLYVILFRYTLICHYMNETWSWHAYSYALGFLWKNRCDSGRQWCGGGIPQWWQRVRKCEECGSLICGKGVRQGLWPCLNRVRKGGGAAPGELQPSMVMALIAIKGGRLIRGNWWGLKAESEGRASLRLDERLKAATAVDAGSNGWRPSRGVRLCRCRGRRKAWRPGPTCQPAKKKRKEGRVAGPRGLPAWAALAQGGPHAREG